MLSININKLRNEVEEREKRKTKVYDKILNLCYQRILNNNKQTDDYACTYIIPNVVFGLPLYDVDECIKFVIDKLIDKGFEVYFAFPTTLHISWKPIDKTKTIEAPKYRDNSRLALQHNQNNQQSYSNQKQNNNSRQYNQQHQQHQQHQLDNSEYVNKPKQYKSVDEYTQSKSIIYNPDDLEIFQSKLDNLFG